MTGSSNEAATPRSPGSGSEDELTTTRPAAGAASRDAAAAPDVVSDPAHDTRIGNEWASEGGATPTGPATSAPAADADSADASPDAEGADIAAASEGAEAETSRSADEHHESDTTVTLDPAD